MKKTLFSVLLLSLLLVSCKNNQNSDSENVVFTEEATTESVSEDTSVANNAFEEDDADADTDEDDTDAEHTNATSDSEDWDAVLDSYEEYVNNYISLLKKAMNGDMDALSEYPSVMEDAQELSEKLQKAQDSMSSSQLSRYTKITNKLTQAAAEL